MNKLFALLIVLFLLSACGGGGGGDDFAGQASRPYYMGFTPFPYAVSQAAIDFSYDEITNNADLVAHHLEEGVPWTELDEGKGVDQFPAALKGSWEQRKLESPPGHKSLVSISPISLLRNGIAPDPDDNPPSWGTDFDLPRTKTAFLRYAVEAVDYFDPDYLVIGIEVNELMHNAPTLWPAYLELHQDTYNSLKALYPGLNISVSLIGMNLIPGYTDATANNTKYNEQLQALTEIMNYSDMYCLSLHTFLTALLADTVISTGELDQIFSLDNKPLGICETSYPAQVFTLNPLTWNGNTSKQNLFFENLFDVAEDHDAQFIVSFVIRDYDDLWASLGSPEDFNKLWKDTGFYSEVGSTRPVLRTWQQQFSRRKQ